MASLDATTVKAIYARKGQATQAVVALEFGVGQTVVSSIWTGKNYRQITGASVHVPTRQRTARTG